MLISQICMAQTGSFFNISATGSNLTISSNIPNHYYHSAGIKIDTPGFSLANSNKPCVNSSKGYCLFSVSNSETDVKSTTGLGPFDITTCLNGVAAISCQKHNIQGNRFIYITNGSVSTSTVTLCSLNDVTGIMSNCTITGNDFASPIGITVNHKKTYAYVTSYTEDHTVSVCQTNPANAALENCRETGSTYDSKFIALNSTDTFAYISYYKIIGSTINHLVDLCSIDQGGGLTNCAPTGSGFNGAGGIAINPAGDIAYVTNNLTNNVSSCEINRSTGELSNCIIALENIISPWRITLNTNGTYAYITTNANSDVTRCTVEMNTGHLSNCILTANGTFGGSGNIAINTSNTKAYIPNSIADSISICSIDNSNGELINCINSDITVMDSVGVSLI